MHQERRSIGRHPKTRDIRRHDVFSWKNGQMGTQGVFLVHGKKNINRNIKKKGGESLDFFDKEKTLKKIHKIKNVLKKILKKEYGNDKIGDKIDSLKKHLESFSKQGKLIIQHFGGGEYKISKIQNMKDQQNNASLSFKPKNGKGKIRLTILKKKVKFHKKNGELKLYIAK